MAVTCLVIGLNEWERYTKPMLTSCQDNAPGLNLLCVDNGSQPPYPCIENTMVMRSDERLSYAGGINFGMQAVKDGWVMVVNNDVLVHKPIADRIEGLNPKELHGFYLVSKESPGLFNWDYLSGWCLIFHYGLWDKVGKFDEKCAPMYFEDADYSIRAIKAGYSLRLHNREDWGLVHLGNTRHTERTKYMRKHKSERDAVMRYVRSKHAK